MLTKFGLSNIIVMLTVAIGLIVIGFIYYPKWWVWLLLISGGLLLTFTLVFFRDPPRPMPSEYEDDSWVVSPCDGKVVEIVEEYESNYIKGQSIRISIFLSPLDLHVNYTPVSGIVEYYEYVPGKYLIAYHPKSSELNEQTKIGVNTKYGKVFFKQIVGILARRLVCVINEGDELKKGEKIGMMKFGSRMDIVLSPDAEIKVEVGQRVRTNSTALARLKSK